jgi:hypothetical protein
MHTVTVQFEHPDPPSAEELEELFLDWLDVEYPQAEDVRVEVEECR